MTSNLTIQDRDDAFQTWMGSLDCQRKAEAARLRYEAIRDTERHERQAKWDAERKALRLPYEVTEEAMG